MKLVKSLIYYKEGSTTKNCSCLIFRNYDRNNFASYETIKSLMQIAKGFYKFNLMNTESNKPLLVSGMLLQHYQNKPSFPSLFSKVSLIFPSRFAVFLDQILNVPWNPMLLLLDYVIICLYLCL